jgi:hypothetical protein
VVTVSAQELMPLGVACAGVCMVIGLHADVYVTVVWAHTAAGQQVILYETSLIKPIVRWSESP